MVERKWEMEAWKVEGWLGTSWDLGLGTWELLREVRVGESTHKGIQVE
jgi:hypothetical protein